MRFQCILVSYIIFYLMNRLPNQEKWYDYTYIWMKKSHIKILKLKYIGSNLERYLSRQARQGRQVE